MFKVKINFDEKKFLREAKKATEKSVTDHYRKQVRGIVCPVHGTSPSITPKGSLSTTMSWNIKVCCDDQLKIVHERLGIKQSSDKIIGGGPSIKDLLGGDSVRDMLGK
jgi:hypothetical protein